MKINIRFMRLSELRPGVQVEYESADGSVQRAVITRKQRGLQVRTFLPEGGYSNEHMLLATRITRILSGTTNPSTEPIVFKPGASVSVSSEDFKDVGTVVRELARDEYEGQGARCYVVRRAGGELAELFDYEMAPLKVETD